MSRLKDAIENLRHFLSARNLTPPTWRVQFVEVTELARIDECGRLLVGRQELLALEDYEDRFEKHLASGAAWINVSCYGIVNGEMVIGIELPRAPWKPVQSTSVNFSGPTAKVLEEGWRADSMLRVT